MPKPDQAGSKAALKTYFPAMVRASSYPNLLTEDLPALAVKAYLVTLRLQHERHQGLHGAIREVALPELPGAAGKRTSQVVRDRDVAAESRPWMVLLPAHGQGTEGVRRGQDECQGASCAVAVQNAGANPGLV